MDLNAHSIIGICFCGIYYSKENRDKFICQSRDFINSYQYEESELPFFNSNIEIQLRHNDIYYCLKVAPLSPNNDYAVISGSAYTVFKITQCVNKFQISWNGEVFNIVMEKKANVFELCINQGNVLIFEKIDEIPQSSFIKFPPEPKIPPGELNTILDACLLDLNNLLSGYNVPEPFLCNNIYSQLETIFTILRDPFLPALQFQRYVDDNRTLLPSGLAANLRQIIGLYSSNISSLFSQFPSDQIKLLVDNYLDSIENNTSRLDMSVTLRPILELSEMYSDGIRGHAKFVIDKLLLDYLKVEIKFQDDGILSNSNVVNKHITVHDLISHSNLREKNKFIVILFEFMENYLPGIILDLKGTIQKLLTSLNGGQYGQVIPKLREVLVTGQIPSYEVRRNEMEAIFLSSINGYSNNNQKTRLEKLICSNSEVFDIISEFFYHKITEIRKCAMEVYVRRAYIVYEICSLEQTQLVNGQLCVLFKFSLPKNHRNNCIDRSLKRSNSDVAVIDNKTATGREFSQTCCQTVTHGYSEKEDISDVDLSNEEYFQPDICHQKSNDYETDSAISAGSMSELSTLTSERPDSESVLYNNGKKPRYSPSINSLDGFSSSSNYSSMKDTLDNMNTSDSSVDKSSAYRYHRPASLVCNSSSPVQDLLYHKDLGVMIVFESIDEIERNLSAIRELLLLRNSSIDEMNFLEYDMSTVDRDNSPIFKVILKLILRDTQLVVKSDDDVAVAFLEFCDRNQAFFDEICVLRITFLLQSVDKTIRYFTFRNQGHFQEDIIVRNIDPTLSFQLEINRLCKYYLHRLAVPNHRMYVYLGIIKEMTPNIIAEYRMFARCIIQHKDFNTSTTNIDYMAKEAERSLIEAMDAFDMAWIDERSNWSKSNHIFFYFHSVLCLSTIDELENVVRAIVFKHGRRLWSLRITQAELKMSVKLSNGSLIPIRLWVHNEGGKSLDIGIYREDFHSKTDHKVLISWSQSKEGRYHGIPVDCCYSI